MCTYHSRQPGCKLLCLQKEKANIVNKLLQVIKKNLTVLLNAGSIVGTTAVTSLLGFAYWWVAARLFTTEAIGLASAMISVMSLLGTISMLGLGTLLTGELTRQPGKEWALINAAIIVVGGAGVLAGVIFAFLAPYISPELDSIGSNILDIFIFALGVGFTGLTMVLDQALIGILRGGLQLGRNTMFAAIKLIALIASFYLFQSTGMIIYITWLIGNVISLTVLFAQRSPKVVHGTPGEIPAASRSLAISGPLTLSGPLSTIERSLRLPCPDCGVLSSNSASYCLNCGYPFSPTVEISSVRPQLLFDYGTIGLTETLMLRKPKRATSGNVCPECEKPTPEGAIYCPSCGYPLTPTIEIPNVALSPSRAAIETVDTLPLLTAIKSENRRQTLSAENTQLFLNSARDTRKSARKYTPLPIDADETLNLADLPKTPPTGEGENLLDRIERKRSELFIEDEKTMDLALLPQTPLPAAVKENAHPIEQKKPSNSVMPQWDLLRKLGGVAIQHHVVNLILLAPSQLLPILVTVLLSATENAYFYVSFMLANFVFSLTYSLTQVLHAVSSAQPSILAQKIRFTFSLSFLASLGANLVLQVGAGLLLEAFSHAYADQAAWCLRILALAVFPIIVKSHYLAICRVYDRTRFLILPVTIGSMMELGLAAAGAEMRGLLGLSFGWFVALLLESLYMAPTVYKAANPVNVNTMAGKKPAKA